MELLKIQITILIYIASGFILRKTKITDSRAESFLSELVINFLLPISVFMSVYSSMDGELMKNSFFILIIAVVFETGIYFLSGLVTKKMNKNRADVARYDFLVCNGGLVGTPVIEGMLGSGGVVLCNIFMLPTRLMAYSAGGMLFGEKSSGKLKAFVTNKVFIAMALGIVLKLCGVILPDMLTDGFSNIGKCLSPMALITIGSMLCTKWEIKKDFVRDIVLISVIRLVALPLIAFAVCRMIGLGSEATTVTVLLMGMPAGSTSAPFAKKYGGDHEFASACVLVTTVLSFFTNSAFIWLMSVI